jgi:hypothetical protein
MIRNDLWAAAAQNETETDGELRRASAGKGRRNRGASESVLLAAIRELRRVHVDLLREAPPDHIASLIERLAGDLEERK